MTPKFLFSLIKIRIFKIKDIEVIVAKAQEVEDSVMAEAQEFVLIVG